MGVHAGFCSFDDCPADLGALSKISSATSEYGPDGANIYLDGPVGMLYRPFHTTAESRLERQPLRFSNGKMLTWDGRLDNEGDLVHELNSELEPRPTAVAVVAAAFERWGVNCFQKLIGDWSLCLWDGPENELTLARDHAGIKQLFYYLRSGRITWCSHLPPLAFCGDKFTLCDEYIAGYLAMFPEAHLTPYEEIRAVAPGSFVSIRNGAVKQHRYWSFASGKPIRYHTDSEYEEHFRHLFRQAVRRRLCSDAPVLAELSGGIDSSSIVCMADDIIAGGEAGTPSVDTISLYDSRVAVADERPFVAQVEAKRGRSGHHVDRAGYDWDVFGVAPDELLATPAPSQDLDNLRSHIHTLIQTHGYRIVISGIGGDEVLGGVSDPSSQLADLIALPRPITLARALSAWNKAKKHPARQLLFRALGLLFPPALRSPFAMEARVEPWTNARFAHRYQLGLRKLGTQGRYGFWLPTRQEFAQRITALTQQLSAAPMSLIGCEERRYPFLDVDLLKFLFSIPAEQLLRPGQKRSLMRRALVDIVPSGILWRKTKGGGNSPNILFSFQRNWPELEKLLLFSVCARMGYVDQSRFLERARMARNGELRDVVDIIGELLLELWLRKLAAHGVVDLPQEVLADEARTSIFEPAGLEH